MRNMLIINGAMKCGTTSLFEYLSTHPAIAPCQKRKEPGFFALTDEWEKGLEYYDSLWDWDVERHQYALEASTFYTQKHRFPNTIDRLQKTNRKFKFIYLVRDPFDRIESHYAHGFADGWRTLKTSELVAAHAIETTKYYSQIQPYIEAFGKENVMILDLYMLKNKPKESMQAIFDYLNLNPVMENNFGTQHNQSAKRRRYGKFGLMSIKINKALTSKGIKIPRIFRKKLRKLVSEPVEYKLSQAQMEKILVELSEDIQAFQKIFPEGPNEWQRYHDFSSFH